MGRFKARVFAALGFDAKAAEAFVAELRRLAATGEVASVEDVGSAGSTLLDTVVLTHDLPEHGLRAGDLGAVVELYGQDRVEVEFGRASGQTKALVTLNRGCAGGRRQRHAHGQDRVARLGDARERPV